MRRAATILLALALSRNAAFGSDWPKYCANLAMTGVAESGGSISPATARNLTLRWSTVLSGPIASSPTVVNGRLYVGDWSGYEWAIDATTGRQIANISLGTTTQTQCNPESLGITSSAAIDQGTLFVAGGDDYFYALDPETLGVKWKYALGDSKNGYYGWCSPAAVGSYVVQGVSSNCDEPFVPGRVVAFNRDAGGLVADEALVPKGNTVGGGVWTSPAIDIISRKVFVTTGSAYSLYVGQAFSIVRMSLDELQTEDSWRLEAADWFDSDWGTSPTLFADANQRQLVGAGQKDGAYYAFLRDELAHGPVWTTQIARAGSCPQCGNGVLSTAAFDGHRLYVGGGQPVGDDRHWGAVTALDPWDGHILWQTPFAKPVIAPIAFANGVVFTTTGASIVALDAETGEVLTTFHTRSECVGGVAITDLGIFAGDLSGTLYRLAPATRRRAVATR